MIGLNKDDCCIVYDSKPEPVPSGLLLLHFILKKAQMESTASLRAIRERITNFLVTLQSYRSDIPKFNLHVKRLQTALSSRGEKSTDLIDHLFKAYLGASDDSFVGYI